MMPNGPLPIQECRALAPQVLVFALAEQVLYIQRTPRMAICEIVPTSVRYG